MVNKIIKLNNIEISNDKPFTLIAGPCQMESEQHSLDIAGAIKEITDKLNIGFIFKTSFDKANRTSLKSKRGLGLEKAIDSPRDLILADIAMPKMDGIEMCGKISKLFVG